MLCNRSDKGYLRALIRCCILILCSCYASAQTLVVDSNGEKLRQFYLSLDVSHLWLKGHDIDWETGLPNGGFANKTYCTKFVAATCKRLNIYTQRPSGPGHSFSANTLYDWMSTKEAQKKGWVRIEAGSLISMYSAAQQYANGGKVVVVLYKDKSGNTPGHSALVRPAIIGYDDLVNVGPVLMQAGNINSDSVRLTKTFGKAVKNFPDENILFYFNDNKIW
ncbi:MAG: hypothetical protein JWQ38_3765 [Flavipsychrobacter sp.]|nr:hypothetical protein [Flavipsychrobacter sp.]